jgi:hypothetical protein
MINSNQTIEDWGDCSSEHLRWSDNAVEDYMAIKGDVRNLQDLINDGELSPIFGTGSPEGAVKANYSLKYIDTDVPTEYYNPVFGADTGWVAL